MSLRKHGLLEQHFSLKLTFWTPLPYQLIFKIQINWIFINFSIHISCFYGIINRFKLNTIKPCFSFTAKKNSEGDIFTLFWNIQNYILFLPICSTTNNSIFHIIKSKNFFIITINTHP